MGKRCSKPTSPTGGRSTGFIAATIPETNQNNRHRSRFFSLSVLSQYSRKSGASTKGSSYRVFSGGQGGHGHISGSSTRKSDNRSNVNDGGVKGITNTDRGHIGGNTSTRPISGDVPHFLRTGNEHLAQSCLFMIRIYGIKARNLNISKVNAPVYLVLDWAEGRFLQKTSVVRGAMPKWLDTYNFRWELKDLSDLEKHYLTMSVIEGEKPESNDGVLIGSMRIHLMNVATGPVHQDFILENVDKGEKDCGRLILDIRMQQICNLIINPIEILVHLHDSGSEDGEEDEDEVDDDSRATNKHKYVCDKKLTKNLRDKCTHCDGQVFSEDESCVCKSSRLSYVQRKAAWEARGSEKQRRYAAALASRKARGELTFSNSNENNENDKGRRRSSSIEPDTTGPLSAHWQLSFSPTGVDNPQSYSSTFTDKVEQPYWNTVDHTLLSRRFSAFQSHDSSIGNNTNQLSPMECSGSSPLTDPSEPSPPDVSGSLGLKTSKSNLLKDGIESKLSFRELRNKKITNEQSSPRSFKEGSRTKRLEESIARMLRKDKSLKDTKKNENTNDINTKPCGLSGSCGLLCMNSTIDACKCMPDICSDESGKMCQNVSGTSNALVSSFSRSNMPHLEHVDKAGTYQRLAALAKRGRLVKDVLYDDFPTIQLVTTIDQLRQNHLKITLNMRVFANESTQMVGESWLPFFKVYDADVVDEVDKHFLHSYFHERLWKDGKFIGDIEGIIVFQNNPIIRQMCAGVQTEHGCCRIFPPVLGSEHRAVKFNVSNPAVPKQITKISEMHEKLLDFVVAKAQHKAQETGALYALENIRNSIIQQKKGAQHNMLRAVEEFQAVCDEALSLLVSTEAETRRTFIYQTELALVHGQRVLLNLANHVLEYLDYVYWQCRSYYCTILSQILRRGELDIGTVVPLKPGCCANMTVSEIYVLYRYVKPFIDNNSTRNSASGINKVMSGGGIMNMSNSSDNLEALDLIALLRGKDGVKQVEGREGIFGGSRTALGNALNRLRGGGGGGGGGATNDQTNAQQQQVQQLLSNDTACICNNDNNNINNNNTTVPGEHTKQCKEKNGFFLTTSPWKLAHINSINAQRREEIYEIANKLSLVDKFEIVTYHKRMKICRQYNLVLNKMLYRSLQKLTGDASFSGQRKQIGAFLCIAYFRIPTFRKELLNLLLTPSERKIEIDEWRGTEFDLDGCSLGRMEMWDKNSIFRVHLDWSIFHQCLNDYFGNITLNEDVESVKGRDGNNGEWKKEFINRGSTFFIFLEHWCRHVYAYGGDQPNTIWHEIIGYGVLLKAFLLEMKARDVTKYPDSLLNCSGAMLTNEKLLSVYIKVIFLKTSVHSSSALFATLNYVDYWAQVLLSTGRVLPSNFDFSFFKKGMEIVYLSDLYTNVAKAIWFTYKNVTILRGDQLRLLIVDICMKNFWRFFLHWSFLVRRCFMWLLLYRISEGTRKVLLRATAATTKNPESLVRLSGEEKAVLEGYAIMAVQLNKLNINHPLPAEALKSVCDLLKEQDQVWSNINHKPGRYKYVTLPSTTSGDGLTTCNNDDSTAANNNVGASLSVPVYSTAAAAESAIDKVSSTVGAPATATAQPLDQSRDISSYIENPPESSIYISITDTSSTLAHLKLNPVIPTGDDLIMMLKYRDRAAEEFKNEISAFLEWVAAGAFPLPIINLPQSPLDAHTDVPLDNQ